MLHIFEKESRSEFLVISQLNLEKALYLEFYLSRAKYEMSSKRDFF